MIIIIIYLTETKMEAFKKRRELPRGKVITLTLTLIHAEVKIPNYADSIVRSRNTKNS